MKNIITLCIIILGILCFVNVSEVNAVPYCTLHNGRNIPMISAGSTATCTKSGVKTYKCLVCNLFLKTTTKTEKQGALGHSWNAHHTCMRCGKRMNGHWFKATGGVYKCIVCSKTLQIESMSPDITYKTGYRVVPYDNPSYVGENIKITFNEIPYDSNGKLMTVTGTSTRYIARNAAYHWGKEIPTKDILKSTYPPYYNGKEIDTKNSHVSTAVGAKTVSLTTPSAGKYVYTVTVNGIQVGSQRRFIKGSTSGDDSPSQETNSTLTIKHIDIDTGKEIVDKEYSKKVDFKGTDIIAYSLPIGENTKYQNYTNVSYKIDSNTEIKNSGDSQYIVKVPNSTTDTTITFYYSVPKFNVKHIIENINKEIVDKELTLSTVAKRPSTIAFSLDVYNKYPILELTGYSIDGERKNISSDNQYAVTVPWNGKSRDVIFYYKYSEVKVNLIVKHIDITTGELMKDTSVEKYSSDKIPNAVASLDLKKYTGYENNGVYIGGQYEKKSGTNQYNISIDVSNINYSMDYVVEFYYTQKGSNTVEYEILDVIPENIESDEIANIGSNAINKEVYDVEKAIPTSENLYVSVKVYNYILKYAFDEVTDIATSKVTFIQPYICNGEEKKVTTDYEVPVSAKYYKLKYLEVYKADTAEIVNKVLPGEKVTLTTSKDTAPTIIYEAPDTYISYNKELVKEITLPQLEVADMKYVKTVVGSYDYAKFEAVSAAQVRNDKLIIDGQIITTSEWKENVTEKPNRITPSIMDDTTLYKNGYTIDKTILNGTYESDGSVTYKKIKSINGKSSNTIVQNVKPNSVVIHTPVVNNTVLDNSVAILSNQKIGTLAKNASGITAKALVLDEEFTIKISNSGMHINEKGYGNRVYNINQGINKNSYAKLKQIKFPFDVYIIKGSNKELIKANTWYTLTLKDESYKFILSRNAKEGAYDESGNEYYIETRVVAENATDDKKAEMIQANANTDNKNYVATNKIFVEVIGRLYDLTITSTNDPNWQLENELKVDEQPIGQAGQNNPKYKYALKLGYSVSFELKTKGEKSDEIVMTPKYFFIDKETGKIQEVDLYYHTTSKRYVKLEEDTTVSNVIFSDYIGAWNGEYRLPSSTLAVPKETKLPTTLTDSNEIFLKDGYILVQFDVKSNYKDWEYLGYDKPNQNTQWQKEEATQTIILPNDKEVTINGIGNFVLYETDYKNSNDYEIGGTH